jgi:hypothetical protein
MPMYSLVSRLDQDWLYLACHLVCIILQIVYLLVKISVTE